MVTFLADGTLGRLVRKLRMLGMDVAEAPRGGEPEIRYRLRAEGRVLLTRDRALASAVGSLGWLVEGEGTEQELSSVARRLDMGAWAPAPFTRCLEDNAALEPCSAEVAAPAVPPRVLAGHREFRRCPACGKVYWPGTHVERMEGEVAKFVKIIEQQTGNGTETEGRD